MAAPSRFQIGSSSLGSPAKRMKLDSPMAAIYPCLICKEPFRRRQDLWEHLTTKEKGINVFVCVSCGHGFCKERLLRTHWCEAVDEEEMSNKQNTALSVLCHVVACEECGLFTGLVNKENPSWRSYCSLCAHPSRSFRKITLYTWTPDAIRFINDLENPFNFHIDFGPAVTSGVPIQCELCGIRYSSVEDVEKHVSEIHPFRYAPVQCQQCSSKFSSPLRMDLHVSEKHGGGDLLDFLKSGVVDEPFVEKAAIAGRTNTYYPCDLCEKNFLGSEFNKHDCAVNYMRRYLLDGKVIFCPAINLSECKVDMSVQDPMLVSLSEKIQRSLELCLRFFVPVVAPKVDDFKADRVYSCNHCERIIISPALFREHVVEAFQEQRIDFEWPKTTNGRDLLSRFGVPVTIASTGFMCPKAGCSAVQCSTVGLELHIRNVHQDTFEQLTIPDFVKASGNNVGVHQPVLKCLVCREQGFGSHDDLIAHIRDWHIHPCNSCSNCFSSINRLNHHKRTSSCGEHPDCASPLSYCPICKEGFKMLSDYYSHLIAQHPANANHDEVNGHILPKCSLFLQPGKLVIPDHRRSRQPATEMTVAEAEIEPSVVQVDCSNDSIVVLGMNPAESLADDDIEVVVSSESRPSTSTSGTVPNGYNDDDDEVAVCQPDSGPGSAGRQASHPCGHCSRMFFTQLAAEEHRKTHEFDAGVITEEVLPVPANISVYICRLCCLAFELYEAYAVHMEKHKRIIDCPSCSAVCLNPQYLASHMESHQRKALAFGCPHCLKAFRSEIALLIHMNGQHGFPLLWHCHKCGVANSDWKQMAAHFCQESHPDLPAVTPTPKRKLHFQPRRIDLPRGESTSKEMDVAECCHRSFLAGKETGIACPQCGTIIPSQTYVASIPDKEKSSKIRLMLIDEAIERQLINSHPSCSRMKPTVNHSSFVKVVVPRAIAPRPPMQTPPNIQKAWAPNPPPLAVMRNHNHIQGHPFFQHK